MLNETFDSQMEPEYIITFHFQSSVNLCEIFCQQKINLKRTLIRKTQRAFGTLNPFSQLG